MTKVKFCGLFREEDIFAANELKPDYIGFVFYPPSKRYVSLEQAEKLRKLLAPEIPAVGVFIDEDLNFVAQLLERGIINLAQLHGTENEEYISLLRKRCGKPIIKAFRVANACDYKAIKDCTADYIMLDAGIGEGKTFDWELIKKIQRPYFLAGGLSPLNAVTAVRELKPFALDVSSGIETNGLKDKNKMTAFLSAVKKEDKL